MLGFLLQNLCEDIFVDDGQLSPSHSGRDKKLKWLRFSADILIADIPFFTPFCFPRSHNICLHAAAASWQLSPPQKKAGSMTNSF